MVRRRASAGPFSVLLPIIVVALLAGAAVAGTRTLLGRAEAQGASTSTNIHWKVGPDGKQATSGTSYVLSNSKPDQVRMREWPAPTNQGAPAGEGVRDLLPDRTLVRMRCWVDAVAPAPGQSPRWFYVEEAGSPHPGYSGYVWSDLVWDQIQVPHCTADLTKFVDPLRNSHVVLSQGQPAKSGYYFKVRLENFPNGWNARVQCLDSTAPNDPFHDFMLVVGSSGSATREDGCFSGDRGQHWVFADGVESNHVSWTTPPKPPPPTGGGGTEPGPPPVVEPPDNPAPTGPPPQPPAPPAPPTRTLTIQNKVTNGATGMREDSTSIYLSSQTRPYCRSNGCSLPGTDMWSGATVTATCQTQGSRMTNGQDNSPVDDGNPGLYTSTLWYGIRWPDGRLGFISEVWITAQGHGGLGLPGC